MMMNDRQLVSWINMWLLDKAIFPEFQNDEPSSFVDRDFDMKVTLKINNNVVAVRGYFPPKETGQNKLQMDIEIPPGEKIIDDGGQLTAFKDNFVLCVKRLYTAATTIGTMQ